MGNEGQQPGQPEQGTPRQQSYYGWQYDQDYPEGMVQQSPAAPQQGYAAPQSQHYPPTQQPQQPVPGYAPQAYQGYGGQPSPQYQQVPPRYQEPIADMGTSLGLGQGTEYQYFNAPQPTQAIPMLRQARLQQLREERMRRQQRRMKPEVTSMFPFRGKQRPPEARVPYPAAPEQMSPSRGPGAPPSMQVGNPAGPPVPTQFSPALPLPPREVSPARSPAIPPLAQGGTVEPAGAPAQDTGMMQKINVGRATLILTGAFIVSRVFGLLRTSLFAFVFGTGAISDAYLQAFVVPDLIFNIVAGGALSSAFIPVFTKYMIGEKDEKMAWHVASAALNLAIGIMVVLALLAIIFAGQIVPIYNPKTAAFNTQAYAAHINLIVSLTRIMLLQAIILGSGVIVNSVLNARQHFLLPAIGTVLYNVGLIIGLIPGVVMAYHGQRNGLSAVYPATWGVVLGAVLQVAIQIPGLVKVGMRYTPTFDWRHPGVIQIGRQMVPRVINASVLYTSIFVDRYLISFLGVILTAKELDGLITQYYQSLQLLLLPLGIFGMAVSTAAFPTLAENVTKGRFDRVRSIIGETLRSILFLSIPSSIGLIVLGLPIIQVLLEHGAFTLLDAERTAYPLAAFAIGLAGLAAVEILTRSFYALRDSTTPVIVSVSQFILKIALSLILINAAVWGPQYGPAALAFSTSIAGLLEAGTLLWLLHQRIGGLQLRLLGIFIGRVLLVSIIMGIGILIIRLGLDMVLVTTSARDQSVGLGLGGTLMAFIKLLIELIAGVFIYLFVARRMGIEELGPIRRVLNRFRLSWI